MKCLNEKCNQFENIETGQILIKWYLMTNLVSICGKRISLNANTTCLVKSKSNVIL